MNVKIIFFVTCRQLQKDKLVFFGPKTAKITHFARTVRLTEQLILYHV